MDITDTSILTLSSDSDHDHDQQGSIDHLLGMMLQMDHNHDHYYTFHDTSPPLDDRHHFSTTAPPSMIYNNYDPHDQYSSSSPFMNPMFTAMASDNKSVMREMVFRVAAMQPVNVEREPAKKRRNVRISKDPQSVAARHRRERISERIRILQRLVPGGTRMDTASMLDEAAHYLKFLKKQVGAMTASCHPPTYNPNPNSNPNSYMINNHVGAMLQQQICLAPTYLDTKLCMIN